MNDTLLGLNFHGLFHVLTLPPSPAPLGSPLGSHEGTVLDGRADDRGRLLVRPQAVPRFNLPGSFQECSYPARDGVSTQVHVRSSQFQFSACCGCVRSHKLPKPRYSPRAPLSVNFSSMRHKILDIATAAPYDAGCVCTVRCARTKGKNFS